MTMKEKLTKLHKKFEVNSLGMSKILGISDNYYSMIYNNKRKPSKKIIKSLVKVSGEPEIYWNGVLDEYMKEHSRYEKLSKLINYLVLENLLIEPTDILKPKFEELLNKAILADVAYELEEIKRNRERQ